MIRKFTQTFTTTLLFFISLFINGVFGDEVVKVSVNDGGSVTLHTLTDLKSDDVITWRFNDTRIAEINRDANDFDATYESDERFTDRLEMNPQTGDLTITNITSELTGEYKLEIINIRRTIRKLFSVGLSPKVKAVIDGDSVSLHIDVTDEQRKDKIHWRIKHKNSLVAEIITENGRVTKNEAYNGFRGILEMDETGDVIITNMKKEDSGDYEADVTIRNTHTIHKTFRFTDCIQLHCRSSVHSSGLSSGQIAGICVGVLLVIAAAGVAGVVTYCCRKMKPQDSSTEQQEADVSLSIEATSEVL